MKIPALHEFVLDQEDQIWKAPYASIGCDLSIKDDDGRPISGGHCFLCRAIKELDTIMSTSHNYITAFCHGKDIGEGAQFELIELCSSYRRGTEILVVYIHYTQDVYGLWTVELTWDQINKWSAVAFGRQNW